MLWWYVAGIGVGVLLLVVLGYFRSFFHDYGYDSLLSFLDEFLGGAVGLDFGDWIAAILMYRREKQRVGGLAATFIAWEATGFLPFSLIPGVGFIIEVIFNLTPTAMIMNFFFNKKDAVEKKKEEFERLRNLAQKIDERLDQDSDAKEAYNKGNYVEALSKYDDAVYHGRRSLHTAVHDKARSIRQRSNRLTKRHQGERGERAQRIRACNEKVQEDMQEVRKEYLPNNETEDAIIEVKVASSMLEDVRTMK